MEGGVEDGERGAEGRGGGGGGGRGGVVDCGGAKYFSNKINKQTNIDYHF